MSNTARNTSARKIAELLHGGACIAADEPHLPSPAPTTTLRCLCVYTQYVPSSLAIRLLAAPRIPKRQEVEDENADERLRDDRGHLPVQGSAAILLASDARVCREERC